MSWDIKAPQGNEAAKVRWELVPYMNGKCLDLGCGPFKVFPHFIGVDNGHHDKMFDWKNRADVLIDSCENLHLFATEFVDLVFSSHLLEHISYENVPATLGEWFRVLRKGGHLCLYVPDEDEYPKVGETGANPDHKWNVSYQKVVDAAEKTEYDWDLIQFEKRNKDDEYSLFFVFKKL
jgi:predicted SAM-dependent methyltransferase